MTAVRLFHMETNETPNRTNRAAVTDRTENQATVSFWVDQDVVRTQVVVCDALSHPAALVRHARDVWSSHDADAVRWAAGSDQFA